MVRPADITEGVLRLERYRLTGADLERMVAAGMFADERIELLEGELYVTPPQDPPHSGATVKLLTAFLRVAPPERLRMALPLVCGENSQPEPDAVILREAGPDDHSASHPAAADTVLVVEIAYTSHARDHHKASIYAAAGAPVYWILDLVARRLHVHTEPGPSGYGVVTILDEHHATMLAGTSIRVGELLPKA